MHGRAVLLVLAVVLAGCGGAVTTERPAPTATAPVTDSPTAVGPTDDATPGPDSTGTSGPDSTGTSGPDSTATDGGERTATPLPPSPTPRRAGKVTVSGRPLSFDEEAVYRAIVTLHGQPYADAPTVTLRVQPRPSSARSEQVFATTPFLRLWGFDAAAVDGTALRGLTTRTEVYLYTASRSPTERRTVLAHEYVHVLQHEANAYWRVRDAVREGDGNARRVYAAVVEGAATYVEGRYIERHLDGPQPAGTWEAYAGNRSRLGAYLVAPYYFGERYVRQRVDSPATLSAVYDRPPTTTEQVVHGYGPGEEPARQLTVAVSTAPTAEWVPREPRPRGELFVRLALAGALSRDRAARAAAGWGADRVVRFGSDRRDEQSYAWVLRWDTAGEADEFAGAMTAYLDARADRERGRWAANGTTFDLRRASPETVVVLAGTSGFVGNASVDGAGGNVTVRVGG